MRWRTAVFGGLWLIGRVAAAGAAGDAVPPHVRDAEALVAGVSPADNAYVHKGCYIHWPGEAGATAYGNRTDCSDFAALLLEHTYHLSAAGMTKLTGKHRPLASTWHDAIGAGRGGLTEVKSLADARAGDLMAVKYPPGEGDTGHVMLIVGPPARRTASAPVVPGTVQWDVPIIDSSKSGHGPSDTRHRPDGTFDNGVGKGQVRLYTGADGAVAGYAWSDAEKSEFRPQSAHHLVIGRLAAFGPDEPR